MRFVYLTNRWPNAVFSDLDGRNQRLFTHAVLFEQKRGHNVLPDYFNRLHDCGREIVVQDGIRNGASFFRRSPCADVFQNCASSAAATQIFANRANRDPS